MSTEEKARADDEALERAKAYHRNELSGSRKEMMEYIFPQLRESEDERIRRTLVEYFGPKVQLDFVRGVPIQKIRAWLEKQKEQTTDAKSERVIKAARRVLNNWLYGDVSADVSGDLTELEYAIREYDGEEKQKEQKPELVQQPPITYTYKSNASRDERLKAALLALLNSDLLKVKEGGYFTKQDLIEWVERIPTDKPAEWSEEDEAMRDNILRVLSCFVGTAECESNPSLSTSYPLYRREIAWLKSLRPQPKKGLRPGSIRKVDNPMKWMEEDEKEREQKPVTWSEEDEKMLNDIIGTIAYAWGETSDRVSWLKSLRPSWKPSEEQMKQLHYALTPGSAFDCDILNELYIQLKKLK